MKSLQDTSIKKIFVLIKNYIRSLKPADIGAAAESHTHNYAGSSSAGGAATSANKVNKSLTVKLNSGATEGTNQFTFDGSAAKSVNVTPSAIGALPLSGGTLTGNLTGKYITGTWLQSTAATELASAPTKYAVLDSSGWVYYRTADNVKSDLNIPKNYEYSTSDLTPGVSTLETGKLYFVYE